MKWFCFFLLIVLFFSCKKDKFHKESFSGIVLHNVTKQPLANQSVLLTVTTYKIGKKEPPEWPNGKPIYTTKKYFSSTDNAGKFAFNFEVDGEWIFSAEIVTGHYIQKIPAKNVYFIFPGDPYALASAKERYDTLFGERTGYVRYHIKNSNDTHSNDTLLASTYYKLKWVRLGGNGYIADEYNWGFIGEAVDQIIIDTIPVESEPLIPVKWLYKRTDTIIFRNENINVLPQVTTDYYIQY